MLSADQQTNSNLLSACASPVLTAGALQITRLSGEEAGGGWAHVVKEVAAVTRNLLVPAAGKVGALELLVGGDVFGKSGRIPRIACRVDALPVSHVAASLGRSTELASVSFGVTAAWWMECVRR